VLSLSLIILSNIFANGVDPDCAAPVGADDQGIFMENIKQI
jgi:hypothetical protein